MDILFPAPSHVVRKARNDHASKGKSCGQRTTNAGEYVSCHRIAPISSEISIA